MKVPKAILPVEYMALHRELVLGYYLMETVRTYDVGASSPSNEKVHKEY